MIIWHADNCYPGQPFQRLTTWDTFTIWTHWYWIMDNWRQLSHSGHWTRDRKHTHTNIFSVYKYFLYLGIHPDFHASKNQANNSDHMVVVPYCPGLGCVTSLVCAPLSATSQDSTDTQSVRWPGTVQLTVTLDREHSRNIVKGQRIFEIFFNNLQKEALSFRLFLEAPCCAAPHESPAPARSRTGPWL